MNILTGLMRLSEVKCLLIHTAKNIGKCLKIVLKNRFETSKFVLEEGNCLSYLIFNWAIELLYRKVIKKITYTQNTIAIILCTLPMKWKLPFRSCSIASAKFFIRRPMPMTLLLWRLYKGFMYWRESKRKSNSIWLIIRYI